MRVEFKEHPKDGYLHGWDGNDKVTIPRMEYFKEAEILVVTFMCKGQPREVVFQLLVKRGTYGLQA